MKPSWAVLAAALWMTPAPVVAQRGVGELRLRVGDATGAALEAQGALESDAADVRRSFTTDSNGRYVATDLPFGVYRLELSRSGFAVFSTLVDIRSEIPVTYPVTLEVAPIRTVVDVTAVEPATILDPFRASPVEYLGAGLLRDRPSGLPGRSIIDLVNTQPGWLLEANGVLHPRGSEYQVQYVIDGVPLRDNRSPAFGQSLGVEEFESMTIRTAGYPAEFGGKLGGVVEVNTIRDAREGFHGSATLQAGSFGSWQGYVSGQYAKGGTTAGASVDGLTTDRYLDPPTEANDSNHGTAGGFSGRLERSWTDASRTRLLAYRRTANFLVPNEALQALAGQRQERSTSETLGQMSHQQVLSSNVLANLAVMARETGATLTSNEASTPIRPSQDRGLFELSVHGSVSVHRGVHEFKFGGETTFGSVRENFASTIVAYSLGGVSVFDSSLPPNFSFADRRDDREQSLFAQDLVRLGPVTVSAGVRYDHYRLMVDESAVSPRVSASWFIVPADVVVHASYDRAFETPPVENIILASSDLVQRLGGEGQSLSLHPARGNFFEAGFSKALARRVRLDGSYFLRRTRNFIDDDLLLNTAVSFPIAFSEARVSGYEAKIDVLQWGKASGSVSYSNSLGVGQLPISGGLFLGSGVDELLNSREQFPITNDRRNTVYGRLRWDIAPRVSVAGAGRYESGLPIALDGLPDTELLVRQYGQAVVAQTDLARGRVRPSSSVDASIGVVVWKDGPRSLRLHADAFNLTNRLNVIDFAGLFSGTALAPRRSFAVRLQTEF